MAGSSFTEVSRHFFYAFTKTSFNGLPTMARGLKTWAGRQNSLPKLAAVAVFPQKSVSIRQADPPPKAQSSRFGPTARSAHALPDLPDPKWPMCASWPGPLHTESTPGLALARPFLHPDSGPPQSPPASIDPGPPSLPKPAPAFPTPLEAGFFLRDPLARSPSTQTTPSVSSPTAAHHSREQHTIAPAMPAPRLLSAPHLPPLCRPARNSRPKSPRP